MFSKQETKKRLKLADSLVKSFEPIAEGVLLAGSVAYGSKHSVRPDSDLDLLLFTNQRLKDIAHLFIDDAEEISNMKYHRFDGLCIKKVKDDVPISLHVLDDNALNLISKSYVANLDLYRSSRKDGSYSLNSFFKNDTYTYDLKCKTYPDLIGSRIIVPIQFRKGDVHYLGIHRDKILSGGQILYDSSDRLKNAIYSLWDTVADIFIDESYRKFGNLNFDDLNILNALNRSYKFDDDIKNSIETKFNDLVRIKTLL